MIARPLHAPKLSFVTAIAIAGLLIASSSGCKKKQKPFPPAPPLLSTATTEGAPLTPVGTAATAARADAGMVAVPVNAMPNVVDTMSPADRAAVEEAKTTVRELDAMVKRGVLTNPDKPDDGDANMKCGGLESSRARLEAMTHPEAKQLVADEKRLCSLEIPLISADKTLKQVTISPSQASRQLMCKYAAKDIEKARKEKPGDRRVRDLDTRFARSCR
ncbi:MAG: hypothetical protein QOI41_5253 [Myxococcales bacterium]|nr:hypothetical protein [Myxococcales bacterium]